MPATRHPLLARDQAAMPPRGAQSYSGFDQEPEAGAVTAEEALQFVNLLLQRFDDDQRGQFVEGLANLIQQDANAFDGTLEIRHGANGNGNGGNGLRDNNRNALDRRRRTVTRDNRRPAQDSAVVALHAQSFARRFPYAMGIKFTGNGR